MPLARSFRVLSLPVFLAISSAAGVAAADEVQSAPATPAGTAVVRAAPTLTDPQTGAQKVMVPDGCTPTTQSTGQLVILCPYREPVGTLPQRHTETKWYGWQILLVDAASLVSGAVLAGAGNDTAGAGVAVIVGGYVLGGPIVHWSNGQVGKGFASLGLRLGAPTAGILTGLAFGAALSGGDSEGAAVGAALGFLGGTVAAVVIDSAAFARKTVVVSDEHAARPKVQWTPTAGYDAKRQAASMGITGTF